MTKGSKPTSFFENLTRTTLHLSKWLLIASLTGLVVGIVIQGFFLLFIPLQETVFQLFWVQPFYLLILPPAAALLVGLILHNKWTKHAWGWGSGIDVSIRDIQGRKNGYSDNLAFPVKFLAQLIGIGFGNSGGLLGPSGRIGQGLVHYFGRAVKLTGNYKDVFSLDMRALATMAMAAGLAATIRLPLGAGLFAIEVIYGEKLYKGAVDREDIVHAELAGVAGAATSILLFQNEPFFGMLGHAPTIWSYPLFVLLGFLAGLTSLMFIKYYYLVIRVFRSFHLPRFIKPFVASLLVSIVTLLVLLGTRGMLGYSEAESPFMSFTPRDEFHTATPSSSSLHAAPNWLGFGTDNVNFALGLSALDNDQDGRYDSVHLMMGRTTLAIPIYSAILILLFLILGKIFATGTYVGSGASGGMIMPSLIIGAALGGAFGLFFLHVGLIEPVHVSAFVAVGSAAVLSGVANAPLSSGIFALELFGVGFLGPVMMATMIAFSISRFETIYAKLPRRSLRDRIKRGGNHESTGQ